MSLISQLFYKKLLAINSRCLSTNHYSNQKSEYYEKQGINQADKNVKPLDWDSARLFEDIPGPKPLPIVGNLHRFFFGEFKDIHYGEISRKLREKYGTIVCVRGLYAVDTSVKIFDPAVAEKLYRNEGIWPIRVLIPALNDYVRTIRKESFQKYIGIISEQGKDWYNIRNKINPILMQPKAMNIYAGPIDTIANDMLTIVEKLRNSNSKNEMPVNFNEYLQKYSFEVSAYVAFNQRIDCLREDMDEEIKPFFDAIIELFHTLQYLDYSPLGYIYKKFNMKPWRDCIDRLDLIFNSGRELIQRAKVIIENKVESKDDTGVFEKLLKIDEELAIIFSIESILAGVETMSKTLGIILYLLAKNKDSQRKLQHELKSLMPSPDMPITIDILNQASYLKAIVRESMRILPVALGVVRITTVDMVLGGYQIPKGTTVEVSNYVNSRNEENYKTALEFIPERWLRNADCPVELSHKNASPFSTLPFGFGSRSCIGKRLALLNIEVLLAKIFRNYEIDWTHKDMTFNTTLTLGCEDPLQFKMTPIQD